MANRPQSPAVMRVIFALQAKGKSTERDGDGWQCQCPAHEDTHPSFAVGVDEKDGKALVVCRAGCSQADVIAALGIPAKDLFLTPDEQKTWRGEGGVYSPGTRSSTSSIVETSNAQGVLGGELGTDLKNASSSVRSSETVGLTVDQYAEAKQLPKEFLQRLGLTTVYLSGMPVVSTPYKDGEGIVRAVQFRQALAKGEHEDGRFFWSRKGTKPLLYGLWRTEALSHAKHMIITEGASDCHTLWLHDLPALGLPGAGSWREEWATALDSYESIYIVREPDKGGEAVEDWVTTSAIRHRVWFVDLGRFKDPSGLYLDNPERFQERWTEAVLHATSWAEVYHAGVLRDVSTLYRNIKPLLDAPDLLDQLRVAINDMGYVGDAWAPMLVYLILTSRLLDRPMNGAVIGPPSVGKNVAVDIAREFLPTEEFHAFEASSPLALIYDDADLRHKAVLVGELDSLPDDGPAGSAIRSLAHNNQTVYDVVEKDKSGKFRTRRICREGPTVLLTTGTKSPAPQLQTRMLEIHLQDDPQLTHAIIERQAEERSLEAPKKPDLQPWKDLQKWLALQASRVRIPFATAIAEALRERVKRPPTRLRRDHPKLLTCIEVITLLYQCQRTRTLGGDLIATLADYEAARTLLEPVFGTIVHDGVTAAIRQTVVGVAELLGVEPSASKTVSESELAKHLKLSKTATQYRVRRCLAGGWLVNHEERKGRAAKLVLDAPLPAEGPILPTAEEVEAYWKWPIRDGPGSGSSVGQSVNDAVPTENVEGTELPEEDCTSEQIIGHPIVQQVNDSVPTEIKDWTTDLQDARDRPPSPPHTNGLLTGHDPALVWKIPPEPDSQQPSSEMLSSPSVEVGVSFESLPYTYITEVFQLEKVLPDILAARTIGLDTETTGLNPRVDHLRLVQLATEEHTYIIDAGTVSLALLAPLMSDERWLIGQNLKFDLQFLIQAGLQWPSPSVRLLDTMLCAQVLDIAQAHSLEAIAHTYLDTSLNKSLQVSDWSGALSQEQLAYAAKDAQVLLPLARVLREKLEDDHLWSTARLESACTAPLAWIELAGMPVDTESWQALAERLSQEVQELRQQLSAMAGTSLNWSSPQQILPVLQARGIPVQRTSHKVLIPYVSDDLVATLLNYKQVSKAVSTYGEKWLSHVDPLTNRVHAEFHSLGTAVGRMTCTRPNLQQIPRGPLYRQKFCVQEGLCLVKSDYSQLHLRIVAVIAPDQAMQAAYANGADLHTVTAAGLQHIAEAAVTKDHRQHAKVFNFGLLYAMGIPRLQAEAWEKYGVRLSDMQAGEQRKQWFKLYPGIRKWHDREQYAISHDHITETRSLLGRRRTGITYLPDRLSSQVLSIEADGAKQALVELFTHREDVPGARIINTIHDEMLVECDASQVPEVTVWLQTHMEDGMQAALKGKAITPVEVSVGQSWARD